MMIKIPVIIPSYQPDIVLLELIEDLIKLNVQNIIVIRDGCCSKYNYIYDSIENNPNCILVTHKNNKGKGASLKTGLKTYICNQSFNNGVVLADADGQHLPKDIIRVIKALEKNPNSLIIGARSFNNRTPLRSKVGNIISSYLFSFLLAKNISDTQSGLRGIPHNYVEKFSILEGNKYEFETNVLIESRKNDINIKEVAIDTVYFNNNKSSHFNPILDSLKIYFLLTKYSILAITSFLLDYSLFIILHFLIGNLAISSYVSRSVSLFFNYQANKNIVFRYKGNNKYLFLKYLLLCFISISVSYLLVYYLISIKINIILAKLLAEICLFFFNFYIQKKYIFKKNSSI